MEFTKTPEALREMGKALFFNSGQDLEKRSRGLDMLIEAHLKKDAEAMYLIARLVLNNVLKPKAEDQAPEEYALELMRRAAYRGCIQARAFLNGYCRTRYLNSYKAEKMHDENQTAGGLVGFDGKPIKIDRTGVFTPIDAELIVRDNTNVLKLSVNVMFVYSENINDSYLFENAVLDGIYEWQGKYTVFGGQKLTVEVDITTEDRLYDNLIVMPITSDVGKTAVKLSSLVGTEKSKKRMNDIMSSKRSFAVSGLKWSVNSRKFIYIQSQTGEFDDYQEIKHVAKHEFGHALGLGDLYSSGVDELEGVDKGEYRELDSYYISGKVYNLVMCDHHGPISNNDIEMVILAFSENKMQLYQSDKPKKKISQALGKGN